MGTYYAPPIGRTGRSVCPYFAFLPASLRCLFSASFFGRCAPFFSVPVSLYSWQGRAAFFRFSLNGGNAPLSYNMQKNLIFIFFLTLYTSIQCSIALTIDCAVLGSCSSVFFLLYFFVFCSFIYLIC